MPSLPTAGDYDVNEFYRRVQRAAVTDGAFARASTSALAGRYSDYSTFGGDSRRQVRPALAAGDELLFRGTYAEGFRAPSIGELFGS